MNQSGTMDVRVTVNRRNWINSVTFGWLGRWNINVHELRLCNETDGARYYCDQWGNEWIYSKTSKDDVMVFGRCKCGDELVSQGYDYDSSLTFTRPTNRRVPPAVPLD